MPDLDITAVLKDSINFSKKELGNSYKLLKPYAEHEFRQFAENAAFLATLRLNGTIEDEELAARLKLQKIALSNVLLAIKGIGIVTAEKLVNGVLSIVGKAVKTAIGIPLPI